MLKKISKGLVTIGVAATGAYLLLIRPWYRRWGATDEEVARSMPGDDEVKQPSLAFTRAIIIKARPDEVWSWLVQIGYKRAGFYSYDRLEKLMGVPITNMNKIIPGYQQLKVGDAIPTGAGPAIPVKAMEPNRFLLLVGHDPNIGEASWVFELCPLDREYTRLVTRARCRFPNWTLGSIFARRPAQPDMPPPNLLRDLVMYLFFEPGSFLMVRKMLLGIKERAEWTSKRIPEAVGGATREARVTIH